MSGAMPVEIKQEMGGEGREAGELLCPMLFGLSL
ncbi:hypothetical protein MNBD_ALPHA07-2447 [hydrothermal vent metagenome]|uniref:Uncharacterized protein n=1 Tax=hydrothermal vent metagenome TaxID=652676 RepID=A0A3B0S5M3_9ZZZZ